MNYIKKLEEENALLKDKLAEVSADLSSFMAYLQSEKFTGYAIDGSRKDWISTGDVMAVCTSLRCKV